MTPVANRDCYRCQIVSSPISASETGQPRAAGVGTFTNKSLSYLKILAADCFRKRSRTACPENSNGIATGSIKFARPPVPTATAPVLRRAVAHRWPPSELFSPGQCELELGKPVFIQQ